MDRNKKLAVITLVGSLVGGLVVGFIVAFATFHGDISMNSFLTSDTYNDNKYVIKSILNRIEQERLSAYFRKLMETRRVAGQDQIALGWVTRGFDNIKMDHVTRSNYKVLLSYPVANEDNKVELLGANGAVLYSSNSDTVGTGGSGSNRDGRMYGGAGNKFRNFNAYSANGVRDGAVVYANYGSRKDFETLKATVTSLESKIAIIRMGEISRGDKIANAEEFKLKGVILYSEPSRSEMSAHHQSQSGIRQEILAAGGSVCYEDGDPLTPGWSSILEAERLNIDDEEIRLPKIPVFPVSATLAKKILAALKGTNVPNPWVGIFSDVTYKFGGEFLENQSIKKVKMSVNNELEEKVITNVVGVIRGEIEPDRYVIVGSHRDAWGVSSADSASASAGMINVAQAFAGVKTENGWRPRRTLVFVSWDASEFGMIGAQEWLEENLPRVQSRTVAYINSDACLAGSDLEATASASVKNVVLEAIKNVKDPLNEEKSYYDRWEKTSKSQNSGYGYGQFYPDSERTLDDITSTSDHGPFAFTAAIPVINVKLINAKENSSHMGGGGGGYNNNNGFGDNNSKNSNMKNLLLCARILAHSTHQLADSKILPFDFESDAIDMQKEINLLDGRLDVVADNELRENNVTLVGLKNAVKFFGKQANNFTKRFNDSDFSNPIEVRMMNDQIMEVQRSFVSKIGIPFSRGAKNVIFGPSIFEKFARNTFPGIRNILYRIQELEIGQRAERLAILRRHLSDLMIVIHQAALHLKHFHDL